MSRPNSDTPLCIRVSSIDVHFDCPVCMCYFTKACLTSCGHRFCEKCIKGCIDSRKKCPCCNAHLNSSQITLDPQFDSLLSCVQKEAKESEKTYFADLIRAAHEQEDKENHREKSPIEVVLQKHLSKSLAQHELFYQKVKTGLETHIAAAEEDKQSRLKELQKSTLTEEEAAVRVVEIEENFEALKVALHQELQTSTELVVDAYDRFLSSSIPEPSVLPITMPVRFLGKKLTLRNQILQPMTSVADVKAEVVKDLTRLGENLVSFPDDKAKFVLLRPFTKTNPNITDELLTAIANQTAVHADVIVMSLECRPLLDIDAQPGSEIVIIGPVKFQSEEPRKCYAKTYNTDNPEATNYYTCEQCKYSWICEICKESCHSGHCMKPKIINYTPSWACCYCLKKKTCYHKHSK